MKVALLVVVAAISGALVGSYGWGKRLYASLGLEAKPAHYLGFVEGENTLVAPPYSGRLAERPLERGDRVVRGARLFVIETTQAEAEVNRAKATLSEMQARHRNLLSGKRTDELEVIRAQRQESEANLVLAQADLKRQGDLLARNVASHQAHDRAVARVAELRAHIASLAARERAGSLSARQDEIAAAEAMVEQGRATLARATDRLDDLMPSAPEDALVESTFFNVGEWVTAGAPVVALLPDHRRKLRFFVHADEITTAQPG
ncbi:MAG: HlyD family secretion protein, partial [Solimonas sp.]